MLNFSRDNSVSISTASISSVQDPACEGEQFRDASKDWHSWWESKALEQQIGITQARGHRGTTILPLELGQGNWGGGEEWEGEGSIINTNTKGARARALSWIPETYLLGSCVVLYTEIWLSRGWNQKWQSLSARWQIGLLDNVSHYGFFLYYYDKFLSKAEI
jgi:hypothetical protein